MPKGIKGYTKGHIATEETRRKIGLANRGVWIKFNCDFCKKENEEQQSKYNRSKKHFCDMRCRADSVKNTPFQEHNAYKGIRGVGQSKQVYHQRYVRTHKDRIAHLKARRYARQKNAEGSHTFQEWKELCEKYGYKCAICGSSKKLTKDHIKPLSLGGTDYINNIQPLCRNCNSRKWKNF